MLTSMGQRGDAKRAKEIGFAAYLTKPVKQSQLYDCLATITGRKTEAKESDSTSIVTKYSISEDQKQKIRILLTEDDITNQKVALGILKNLGFRADIAGNGKEAVKALEMIPYDLVLMDIHMPEMDGYEATREIRKLEAERTHSPQPTAHNLYDNEQQQSSIDNLPSSIKRVPIIAMTANAMEGDREKCIESGMNDYVPKPIDPEQLLSVLLKWARPEEEKPVTEVVQQEMQDERVEEKLPDTLPGIDIESCLKRLGGNKELFIEILGAVSKDYADTTDEIRDAIQKGDKELAQRLAHTLKGVAGNISAKELYEAARMLELGIKQDRTDEFDGLLADFQGALNVVLESTRTL